jgi:hypothetical protein
MPRQRRRSPSTPQFIIDSLLAAPHVLEIFRRALPNGRSRSCLDRLSNRLTKIVGEACKRRTPENGQKLAGYAENNPLPTKPLQ